MSLLFAWGINTERWVVHSQVAGTKVIFEGGRLGSFATPRWSEKDGVGGFFLLRTFDTMGQFIQEIFGAEIGEVERGHGLLRLRRFGGSVLKLGFLIGGSGGLRSLRYTIFLFARTF